MILAVASLGNFPAELVHEILRYAAQSSPSACRALCQVSTWARRLALPHLYTTVPIRSEMNLSRFLSSIMSTPLVRSCVRVQIICIAFKSIELNQESFQTRTACLPNLSHLAFTACNTTRLARMCTFAFIPTHSHRGTDLHVLIIRGGTGMPSYSHHHLFSRIMHLRIADPVVLYSQLYIAYMRRLTHVAVPCGLADADVILPIIEGTLVVLPSGRVNKGYFWDIENWVHKTRRLGRSERIYAVRPLCGDIRDEWGEEIRGGVTIWERAFGYTRLLMARSRVERSGGFNCMDTWFHGAPRWR